MITILLLLIYISRCSSFGYDSGTDQAACGKPLRAARLIQPPCDLAQQSYCVSAGTTYPWHAVRRFIRENQGLMRRMYGSERQITILRAELENEMNEHDQSIQQNSINDYSYNNGEFKSRYSKQDPYFDNELFEKETYLKSSPRLLQDTPKRDDVLNTKFVYSEEPSLSVKISDLKTMPHFRPTTQKVTTEKTTVTTPSSTTTTSAVLNNLTKTLESNSIYENLTVIALKSVEENFTVTEVTLDDTTTDTFSQETTTASVSEETTTEETKKKPNGAILFQDMDESVNKMNNMNYKLRGVNACPVKEEVVAPFWANNTRGEVLALLNLYPFEQYVHWEKCTYEHRQMYCRDGCRCEQQYRLHRLLAYDPKNECRGIFSDWFRFPSCCVCKCYDMPAEFRVTSRSPRNKEDGKIVPSWFKKRSKYSTNG